MTAILDANARKLDVGTLLALRQLLSERNLSRVGRDVGLSQPAMSHALARLRRVFDDQLLVRDGNALTLTPRADQLREQLDALLPELVALFEPPLFEPATSRALFKIAITDHAGQVLLPRLLRRLSVDAPLVRTSIAIIPNRQTDVAELDNNRFDTRMGWLRSLPPHWRRRKLLDDQIVLVAAVDHPDLSAPLTVERFTALEHIALESEKPIYPNLVDSFLAARGLSRNIVTRVSHFSIVPAIVAETRMVAMMPRRLAETYVSRNLVRIARPPIDFPDHDLSVAWHPRVHLEPSHVWLRQILVACALEEVEHEPRTAPV